MSLLPLAIARYFGKALGGLYYKLNIKRVRIARINIQMCFPHLSTEQQEALIRDSLQHTGMWVFEAGAAWFWSCHKIMPYVQVKNFELFEQALAEQHGVILAIPHLGNWELINSVVNPLCEFACLYKHDDKSPLFSHFVCKQRTDRGIVMAPANSQGIRTLYKHLRKGNVIGLLPDHQPSRSMGVFAPFFNIPALTGTLISSLARKNNAKVLTATVFRTEAGFEVVFNEVPDQHSEDELLAATSLNRALEESIKLEPAQFQWVYTRFSKRPEGQNSPYKQAV